jgi:hypothetical protein
VRFLSTGGVTFGRRLPYAIAMKSHLIAALLLSAASAPAFSQQPPAPLPPVSAQSVQLREAALQDDYAWDIVEGLTTEVGQRLAGTEAEARARTWAVAPL